MAGAAAAPALAKHPRCRLSSNMREMEYERPESELQGSCGVERLCVAMVWCVFLRDVDGSAHDSLRATLFMGLSFFYVDFLMSVLLWSVVLAFSLHMVAAWAGWLVSVQCSVLFTELQPPTLAAP
jgi:hypothetical protein